MKARMNHPAMIVPGAMEALQSLSKSAQHPDLPEGLRAFVELRASQINGCSFCVDMHSRDAKKAGETDERIWAVAAWRESPEFTDPAERAALALTEAMTRVADRPDPVSDEVYEEAARYFSEPALAALMLTIAGIQVWNRLNAAIRQPAGAWRG